MRQLHFYPTALLALVLPLLAGCEGFRTVSGRVVDPAGNPVPDASVRVREDEFVYGSGGSDGDGRFEVKFFYSALDLRAPVVVEAPGFRRVERWVWFGKPRTIVLVPDSVAGRVWGPFELVPRLGVAYGVPLRGSGSVGAAYGRYAGFGDFAGVAAAVEGGEGGARVRAGVTRTVGRFGGELSGAVLRTSGDSWTVAPRQTFAGAEARLFLRPVTVSFGAYSRVAGGAPGDERLLAVGIGLGY